MCLVCSLFKQATFELKNIERARCAASMAGKSTKSWDILRLEKFLSVERLHVALARLRQDPSLHHPSVAVNSRSDASPLPDELFFVGSDDLLTCWSGR